MLSKNLVIKSVTLLTAVAFWCVSSMVVLACLLYTSDAADERSSVDLGGRRIIKQKKIKKKKK